MTPKGKLFWPILIIDFSRVKLTITLNFTKQYISGKNQSSSSKYLDESLSGSVDLAAYCFFSIGF